MHTYWTDLHTCIIERGVVRLWESRLGLWHHVDAIAANEQKLKADIHRESNQIEIRVQV